MNVVFFGNTKYSVIDEETLHKKFGLSLVVTNPDRPTGRKRKLSPSPVKSFAIENNIPVLTFERLDSQAIKAIKNSVTLERSDRVSLGDSIGPSGLQNDNKIDFLVVADYGLILPNQVLQLPKYAALNVHHSLLPKYRGPSPAPTAILNGEKISGVTIIKMTWDVDAGDIVVQKEYELKENETTDSLLTELNKLGAQLAIEVIQGATLSEGGTLNLKGRKQDDSKATYTHRFTKSDGQIDLNDPPDPIAFDRMVRAFYPWPGVWSKCKMSKTLSEVEGENGKWKILKFLPGNLIQPEGKRPLTITQFKNGYGKAYELIRHLFKPEAQS